MRKRSLSIVLALLLGINPLIAYAGTNKQYKNFIKSINSNKEYESYEDSEQYKEDLQRTQEAIEECERIQEEVEYNYYNKTFLNNTSAKHSNYKTPKLEGNVTSINYKGVDYTITGDYDFQIPTPNGSTEYDFGYIKDGVFVITEDSYDFQTGNVFENIDASNINKIITTDNVNTLGKSFLVNYTFTNHVDIYLLSVTHIDDINIMLLKGDFTIHCDNLVEIGSSCFSQSTFNNQINFNNVETIRNSSFFNSTFNVDLDFPKLSSTGNGCFNMGTYNDIKVNNLKNVIDGTFYNITFNNLFANSLEELTKTCFYLLKGNDVYLKGVTKISSSALIGFKVNDIYLNSLDTIDSMCLFGNSTNDMAKCNTIYLDNLRYVNSISLYNLSFNFLNISSLEYISSNINMFLRYCKGNDIELNFSDSISVNNLLGYSEVLNVIIKCNLDLTFNNDPFSYSTFETLTIESNNLTLNGSSFHSIVCSNFNIKTNNDIIFNSSFLNSSKVNTIELYSNNEIKFLNTCYIEKVNSLNIYGKKNVSISNITGSSKDLYKDINISSDGFIDIGWMTIDDFGKLSINCDTLYLNSSLVYDVGDIILNCNKLTNYKYSPNANSTYINTKNVQFFVDSLDVSNIKNIELDNDTYLDIKSKNSLYFNSLQNIDSCSYRLLKSQAVYFPELITYSNDFTKACTDRLLIPKLNTVDLDFTGAKSYDGSKENIHQIFISEYIQNIKKNADFNSDIIITKGSVDLSGFSNYNLYSSGFDEVLTQNQVDNSGENIAILGKIPDGVIIPENKTLYVRTDSDAEDWCIENNRKYKDLDSIEADKLFEIDNPYITSINNSYEVNNDMSVEVYKGGLVFDATKASIYIDNSLIGEFTINENNQIIIPSSILKEIYQTSKNSKDIESSKHNIKFVFNNVFNTTYQKEIELIDNTPVVPPNTPDTTPTDPVLPDDENNDSSSKPEDKPNNDSSNNSGSNNVIIPPILDSNQDNNSNTNESIGNIIKKEEIGFEGNDITVKPNIDLDKDYTIKFEGTILEKDKDYIIKDNSIIFKDTLFKDKDTGKYEIEVNQGNNSNIYIINIKVPSIKIRKLMGLNNKFKLKLYNSNDIKSVKWSSKNSKLCTVDSKGVIRTKNKTGIATIECDIITKDGYKYKFICKVDIRKKIKNTYNYINKDIADKKNPTIILDKEIHIKKPVQINFNNLKENSSVKYYSSNNSIAKVNSNGKIVGYKKGKCNIKIVINQNNYKYVYYINTKVTK